MLSRLKHGSFITQFVHHRKFYPSADFEKCVRSKKVIDRRLILPLEEHNWVRALEILSAKYAKRGRSAVHYQQVLRDMISRSSKGNNKDIQYAIESIRDAAFSDEIPSNVDLWVTITWCYSKLQLYEKCLETVQLSDIKYPKMSAYTRHYLGLLILPLIVTNGDSDVFSYLCSKWFSFEVNSSLEHKHEYIWKSAIQIAAYRGKWTLALQLFENGVENFKQTITFLLPSFSRISRKKQEITDDLLVSHRVDPLVKPKGNFRYCNSDPEKLSSIAGFDNDISLPLKSSLAPSGVFSKIPSDCDNEKSFSDMGIKLLASELSSSSWGGLLLGLCHDYRWVNALCIFSDRWISAECTRPFGIEDTRLITQQAQYLLNCLGFLGKWEYSLSLCEKLWGVPTYQPIPSSLENETPKSKLLGDKSGLASRLGTESSFPLNLPFDQVSLHLLCHAIPSPVKDFKEVSVQALDVNDKIRNDSSNSTFSSYHCKLLINILDEFLAKFERVEFTDTLAEVVIPSLFYIGSWVRALHMMKSLPSLSPDSRSKQLTLSHAFMAYFFTAKFSDNLPPEANKFLKHHFPWFFPLKSVDSTESNRFAKIKSESLQKPIVLGESNVSNIPTTQGSLSISNLDDDANSSTGRNRFVNSNDAVSRNTHSKRVKARIKKIALSDIQDDYIYLNRMYTWGNYNKLLGSSNDYEFKMNPHADPRPIPKGIHDSASGWNFYRRGGEMAFYNSKSTPHPFNMHPKAMRALQFPLRGWNPRINSSWAHRENVRKWNKKSAV